MSTLRSTFRPILPTDTGILHGPFTTGDTFYTQPIVVRPTAPASHGLRAGDRVIIDGYEGTISHVHVGNFRRPTLYDVDMIDGRAVQYTAEHIHADDSPHTPYVAPGIAVAPARAGGRGRRIV